MGLFSWLRLELLFVHFIFVSCFARKLTVCLLNCLDKITTGFYLRKAAIISMQQFGVGPFPVYKLFHSLLLFSGGDGGRRCFEWWQCFQCTLWRMHCCNWRHRWRWISRSVSVKSVYTQWLLLTVSHGDIHITHIFINRWNFLSCYCRYFNVPLF